MTMPLSQCKKWRFDDAGALDAIKKIATDILEEVTEAFQNAMDSTLPTTQEIISDNISQSDAYAIPNMIDINFPGGGILWSIQDSGRSIAKEYDYKIARFLDAKKAESLKEENPYSCGHKGLGMSLYFLLSNRMEVVSQDSLHDGVIHRFQIYSEKNEKGKEEACFSDPETKGITPEIQNLFGIDGQGTKVTFFNTYRDNKDFTPENVIERIKHSFGLRISWMSNLIIRCNGEQIDMTSGYMKGYPEESILSIDVYGQRINITGNVHEDKHGSSKLYVIGRGGQLIMEHTFGSPRRCSGYAFYR